METMDHDLRQELLRREALEQELRRELLNSRTEALQKRLDEVDRDNTEWLRGVVETIGWPGRSVAGTDGAHAAWLIVQHSPDLDFKERCAALLEAAVANGEAEATHLAYLVDRIRVFTGRPQLYGTQGAPRPANSTDPIVPAPIEDPEGVDERRAALGLEPIADYFEKMNEHYGLQTGRH